MLWGVAEATGTICPPLVGARGRSHFLYRDPIFPPVLLNGKGGPLLQETRIGFQVWGNIRRPNSSWNQKKRLPGYGIYQFNHDISKLRTPDSSFNSEAASLFCDCSPPLLRIISHVCTFKRSCHTCQDEDIRAFQILWWCKLPRHLHQSDPPPHPLDKEEPLSVTLEGPIGGSLAFALSPAFGQDSVQQPRGPVSLGLGGQGWKSWDLGPPCLDVVLVLAVPPSSSSSSPPQRLSTRGTKRK